MGNWKIITSDAREYDLESYGLGVPTVEGDEYPPLEHVAWTIPLSHGGVLDSIWAKPRHIVITPGVGGDSRCVEFKRELMEYVIQGLRPDRTDPIEPFILRYTEGGTSRDLHCFLAEFTPEKMKLAPAVTIKVGIHLVAYDPFFTGEEHAAWMRSIQQFQANYIAGPGGPAWAALNSGADGIVYAVAVSPTGLIYAGGAFHNIGGVAVAHVAVYNPATNTWAALGAGVDDEVYALAVTRAGILYAGGAFHNAGGGAALHIASWNGAAWAAVGAGLDDVVYALAVTQAGNIYAGGAFINVAGGGILVNRIAYWNGAWNALGAGPGVDDIVRALSLTEADDLYLGGAFHNAVAGIAMSHVGLWRGPVFGWQALGVGTDNDVRGLSVSWQDGHVYVAGLFLAAGGLPAPYSAAWDIARGAWEALGSGLSASSLGVAASPDGPVYFVGNFTNAGGQPATRCAWWDVAAGEWRAMTSGLNTSGYCVTVSGIGTVYLGGSFTSAAGNAAILRIAAWYPETRPWSALGLGVNAPALPGIYAMATAEDGTLYVGGNFTFAGGLPVNYIAAWDPTNAVWRNVGGGVSAAVYALAVAPTGLVYAGGAFHTTIIGPINLQHIGVYDPVTDTWASMGGFPPGLNDSVYGLAVAQTGLLYIGGTFTQTSAGAALNRIASWDPVAAAFGALGAGPGVDSAVNCVTVAPSGKVYFGGWFLNIVAGPAANYVVSWDPTTATLAAVGAGVDNIVNGLAIDAIGILYATGQFVNAGGAPASRVASWNGASWAALGAGVNNIGYTVTVSPDGLIWFGGTFTSAGGVTLYDRMAIWNGSAWFGVDIDLPGIPEIRCIVFGARKYRPYVGTTDQGYATTSISTDLTNAGSRPALPSFEVWGPGVLQSVKNEDTSDWIPFRYTLQDGEHATLDLTGVQKTFDSDWWGSLIASNPVPGSDLVEFDLAADPQALAGVNEVSTFVTSQPVEANDGGGQLAGWACVTGLTDANTDDGRLYASIALAAGVYVVTLYRDVARAIPVAHTRTYVTIGGADQWQPLIPDGGSGVGGRIMIDAFGAADMDITVDFALVKATWREPFWSLSDALSDKVL